MMFAKLLAHPDVKEVVELRGKFGFMAYHGGGLEHLTDVIAQKSAEQSNSSYYGVHQPRGLKWHVPSHEISPNFSTSLQSFINHVDIVVTIHGFGREGFFTSLLLGGRNRNLAGHMSTHLKQHLPMYEICDDLETIPVDLRAAVRRCSDRVASTRSWSWQILERLGWRWFDTSHRVADYSACF
ncbi:MAG: hypothetical protein EBT42_04950 [Actinobacteria bacterium]|nr:hypothetical protein [Actinomycetota bacterium]